MSENSTNAQIVDRLLRDSEVAAMCGVARGTVRQWEANGIGPKSFRINGARRWRESVVYEWIATQEAASDGPDAA